VRRAGAEVQRSKQEDGRRGAREAAAWPKWLATATIPDISAALTGNLDLEHPYKLVHTVAGHLRSTKE
jgi:hypothetical protein